MTDRPIRLFTIDLNFARVADPDDHVVMSTAADWRDLDVDRYVHWAVRHGATMVSAQAWAVGGYAFYDSRLGPRAVGRAGSLLPEAIELAGRLGLPVQSYVTASVDPAIANSRRHWLVPGSRDVVILGDPFPHGFLAPESPWTDLLCDRVAEALGAHPVDWLLIDWFCYGTLTNDLPLVATPYARPLFRELFGRPMPDDPAAIRADEAVAYRREALARQFHRLRDTVRETSPRTRLIFNVPYFAPAEPTWVDHPMLLESDGLFAETSRPEIVDWLLTLRRPDQRVWVTIHGRPDDLVDGEAIAWSDRSTWRHWADRGCDLVAWAWGIPTDARVHPVERPAIREVTDAFQRLAASDRTS
jgi:hypothetical protein